MKRQTLALLLLLLAPTGAAAQADPVLQVRPRVHQGVLYLGLTPLGATPLVTPLPVGRGHTLTLYRSGFSPVSRTLTVRPGDALSWRPLMRPPMGARPEPAATPPWVGQRCLGQPCGLGAATHFSPMMAQSLAIGRAITEAARTVELRVSLMDASYREAAGAGIRTASVQRTHVSLHPGTLDLWSEGGRAAARVSPGGRSVVVGVGAASRLGPTARPEAQATLAARIDALRWHRVFSSGRVRVDAVVRTYGDEFDDGRYLEDERVIRHTSDGPCGALQMELKDHQRLIQGPGARTPALGWAADRVELRLGAAVVELRDGVVVSLEGATVAALSAAVGRCLADEAGPLTEASTPHAAAGMISRVWLSAPR